jgi:2-oxoglutarate dehydrogenase E1 component
MTPQNFSVMLASDPTYLEELYQRYLKTPSEISPDWKNFFDGYHFAAAKGLDQDSPQDQLNGVSTDLDKEFKVFRLIQSYRTRGHLVSTTNPIRPRKDRHPVIAARFISEVSVRHLFRFRGYNLTRNY